MKKVYKYENIQIGNFLISIGYYLREFNYNHPISINLHQQTPNDYTIGDLFGALAGSFFIIEFKSDKEKIKDELKKPQRKKLIEKLDNEYKNYIETSTRGHFICYPSFFEDKMEFNLNPYVTIDDNRYDNLIINGVPDFLKRIFDNNSIGVSYKQIEEYLKLLRMCADDKRNTSHSSGILLNFDKKEGVKYIIYDDLYILNKRIRLEHEISQEMKLTQEQSKKRSYGYGMGM